MKTLLKTSLLSLIIIQSSFINAQVGINTANPQTSFHVEGSKDNPVTGTPSLTQQSNDFVVTSSGNVGLGTTTPDTKLSIENGTTNGAIKITDGTQGMGKVLTSDANGIGTWNLPGVSSYVGSWDATYANKPLPTTLTYNGLKILNIPPGKYYVVVSVGTAMTGTANSGRYVGYGLNPSVTPTSGTHFLGLSPNTPAGTWFVENTSCIINITSTSTLYFFQNESTGNGTIGCCQDQFSAIAIKLS